MKRLLTAVLLSVSIALAFAQEPATSRVYCELVGSSGMFSSKVRITIDFGQERSFWKGSMNQQLVGEDGKDSKFNSMVDAMNFMGKYGWKFVQAYTIGDAKDGYVYHWLLYKDIVEESEMFEGFMTKEQYKKRLLEGGGDVVYADYTITYLESKNSGRSWDIVREEFVRDLTPDELTAKMNEWKLKSSGNHLFNCKAKKEK